MYLLSFGVRIEDLKTRSCVSHEDANSIREHIGIFARVMNRRNVDVCIMLASSFSVTVLLLFDGIASTMDFNIFKNRPDITGILFENIKFKITGKVGSFRLGFQINGRNGIDADIFWFNRCDSMTGIYHVDQIARFIDEQWSPRRIDRLFDELDIVFSLDTIKEALKTNQQRYIELVECKTRCPHKYNKWHAALEAELNAYKSIFLSWTAFDLIKMRGRSYEVYPPRKRRRLNDQMVEITTNQCSSSTNGELQALCDPNNTLNVKSEHNEKDIKALQQIIKDLQDQVDALKQENTKLKQGQHCATCNLENAATIKSEHDEKEFISMRQRIEYLEYQLDAQKRQNQRRISDMLLRMKALKEMAIKGSDPLYDSVSMHSDNKTKNRKYSRNCHQLRKKVMHRDDGNMVLTLDLRDSRKSRRFQKAICEFWRANSNLNGVLDHSLAELVIAQESYDVVEVLEEFVISKPHRIPSLIGQKGLRAKRNIPRNTCLGQYVGVTYLKEEYLQIFENSSEVYLRNMYAFDLKVDVDGKEVELVLDGYALTRMIGESGHLTRINDCRLDIHQPRPTNDDRMFENVEIVQCKVNGWPVVFVVNSKDINAGEELCAWFGENFGDAMKGWDENMKWRHRIRMCLDSQVVDEERDALINDPHDVYD